MLQTVICDFTKFTDTLLGKVERSMFVVPLTNASFSWPKANKQCAEEGAPPFLNPAQSGSSRTCVCLTNTSACRSRTSSDRPSWGAHASPHWRAGSVNATFAPSLVVGHGCARAGALTLHRRGGACWENVTRQTSAPVEQRVRTATAVVSAHEAARISKLVTRSGSGGDEPVPQCSRAYNTRACARALNRIPPNCCYRSYPVYTAVRVTAAATPRSHRATLARLRARWFSLPRTAVTKKGEAVNKRGIITHTR